MTDIGVAFGCIGFVAVAVVALAPQCDSVLAWVARYCTARRMANVAFREEFRRYMRPADVDSVDRLERY